jgi:two-component system LytT family response regulator
MDKPPIKAIIIDDELYCCETIATFLERIDDIEILAQCSNGVEGIEAIQKHKPDLVFLDVEMPKMNGFEMLQKLTSIQFEIIFTTSYDQYALKAIQLSAIDYLLKPIDEDELLYAIEKVRRRSNKHLSQQLEILMKKLSEPKSKISKIALPTMDGLEMASIDSIIYCESDSNYTIVHFKDAAKIVVSKTLKEIEELLQDFSFVRVHRCYLVNINEIEKYKKGEGGYLILSNGASVDVSKNRKELLLSKLQPLRR